MMKKSTHPLFQLLVMALFALSMLVVVGVATFAVTTAGLDVRSRSAILWMQAVTQLLTFVVPVVAMSLIYYRGSLREYYRLDFKGRAWLGGLAGAVAMLLLIPINDWLTVWNDSWQLGRVGEALRALQDQTEALLDQMINVTSVGGLLANLLVIALVPAVCEELFFRAGVQNLLHRWLGNRHAAIWLAALIFSLGHGEVFAFMPRLVLGAALGYLYVYSGSIVVNAMAHFVNNALVVVLYWLVARGTLAIDPAEPLRLDVTLTVCCTLAAVALFYTTFAKKMKDSH